MPSPCPHEGTPSAARWRHVRSGLWSAYSGMSRPGMDHAGVALLRAGSNSCLLGFRTPNEADTYRSDFDLGPAWKTTDNRPPSADHCTRTP